METGDISPHNIVPLSLQETPRSDVDEILRRKRKAREYKACYPCRQRKVKCDQNVPCRTCVAREHPELCTYHPPSETHPPAKRAQLHATSGGLDIPNGVLDLSAGTVTLSREDWDRICAKLIAMENSMAELRGSIRSAGDSHHHEISHAVPDTFPTGTIVEQSASSTDPQSTHFRTQGIHTTNDLTGETVHVGGSSVPALIMALGRGDHEVPGVQELLGKKSILPLFGLDNESATYPFVDLWGLPHGSILKATEISGALPSDQDCLSLFRYHRETAHIIYPALTDIDKFESDLLLFLINRANNQQSDASSGGITEQSIYGKNLHWIGLFFAALASGCQCSSMPRKERDLTSQVYVCCSFECLRFTNFLSQPTLETIQTLLILGNVISNNMNAGVAWSLMGLTVRLAQSIGIHRRCPATTPHEVMMKRSKLWWTTVWQDTHLSISYDRLGSSSLVDDYPYPGDENSSTGNRTYAECMYRLVRCGIAIVEDRAKPQNSDQALEKIIEHRNELQNVVYQAADYLRDSRRCRSMRDQLEHWALYLYMSYITSELCRPALNPSNAGRELSKTLRKTCIDALTNTVEAFLGLQNMTAFASRSWVAVHRALSSSLLLCISGETLRNDRARTLVGNLVTSLSEIVSKVDPVELSAPLSRSIAALRKLLNLSEASVEIGSESAASESPIPFHNLDNLQNLLSFDDPTYGSESPLTGLDLDQSPYALVDSIIWGASKA